MTYSVTPIKLTGDLSEEILKARRECSDILQILSEKFSAQNISYRAIFVFENEIKFFHNKEKLQKFASSALQMILKDILMREKRNRK